MQRLPTVRRRGRAAAGRGSRPIPATARPRSSTPTARRRRRRSRRHATSAAARRSPPTSARRGRPRGAGRPSRFRVRRGVVGWDDLVRDRVEIDTANLGGDFVIVRGRRHAALPLHGGGRRRGDGDQPRDPRRGPRQQHAQAHPAVRGPGPADPGVRPPAADPQPRRHQDVEAQEPDGGRRLHRAGLRQARRSSTTSRSSAGRRAPRRRSSRSPSSSSASTSRTSRRAARGSTASGSSG